MKTVMCIPVMMLAAVSVASAQPSQVQRQLRYRPVESSYDVHITSGERRYVERLANSLWNDVNAVCWEAYANYRHEANWDDTYREMRQMLDEAGHIRELIHDEQHHHAHDERDHIVRDLQEMDQLFHHLEDDIRRWHPHFVSNRPDYDDYHHPIRRDPYRHHGSLRTRMNRLESTLHHHMELYDVASLPEEVDSPAPNDAPNDAPLTP